MTIETKEMISDLKLLIDISSADPKHFSLFEGFHKKLIRIAYKAIGIRINYKRKRVNLHVVTEDPKGEYLDRFDENLQDIMVVDLSYRDLNKFLASCIVTDISNFKNYYEILKSEFLRGKTARVTPPVLENKRILFEQERLTS